MNAKIDMAAALILYLILCFGASLAITGSLPLAMVITYAAGILARIAYVKWLKPRLARRADARKRLDSARALVKSWAYIPDEKSALEYVSRARDMSNADFILLARHDSSPALDANAILDAWRSRRGKAELIIAATCGIDEKAEEIASSLKKPSISVLDAARLARAIAQSPLGIPTVERPDRRKPLNLKINKKHAPRVILSAISTFLIYAVTNKIIYLLSASALLFLSLAAFVKKPKME